ncbi:transglutaminase domain-containing protein [Reichenbachiella sp.]|uniref:transglutaminase domain-containing protein n=1 Tax=Reichenbachiella sp. TaxID=2184521 RepID=UPI003B59CAA4
MHRLSFTLFLLAISQITCAQEFSYQVDVNNHRAGSYRVSTEVDQNIHTFTSLDFNLLTLYDSLNFHSTAHFIESDSGHLESVFCTTILKDTLSFKVKFDSDTIHFTNLSDSSIFYTVNNSMIFGPDKIRKLSKIRLDTIGSSLCYQTFSTELNQVIEVTRELIDFSIEKANKLRIVKETVGSKSTLRKFDSEFNLVETKSQSALGEIRLIRTNKVGPSQFLESDLFKKNHLLSNIRFPDPININSTKIKVEGLDSLSSLPFKQHNQNITFQDSNAFVLILDNIRESSHQSEIKSHSKAQLFFSTARANEILDSLEINTLTLNEKINQIKEFSKLHYHPNLVLFELLSSTDIPVRIVYGYYYDRWFWMPNTWVEVAINDYWELQDLTCSYSPNAALRIALFKSQPGSPLSHSYLDQSPTIENLHVQSFSLKDKKYSVSSQVFPYYFENPVYENEGLGIRMNIPDGFYISNDGTASPADLFLSLENDYNEKIDLYQVLISDEAVMSEIAKEKIFQFVKDKTININKDKKLPLWYGFKGKRGAIVIPQGESYIFITIEHEDPEFMIFILTRKNLMLKFKSMTK